MKTLRQAFAALLAVVIVVPASSAASLYRALARPAAPPVATLAVAAPRLPAAAIPALGVAAVPAVAVPGALQQAWVAAQTMASAGDNGGVAAQASLAELFDEDHVRFAIGEYFGVLAPGEEPGVVVSHQVWAQGAPGDDEMLGNVKESKKTNPEREAALIRIFVRNGAKYDPATAKVASPDFTRTDEVQLQEVLDRRGRPTGKHNIFVFKKGRNPDRGIIVNSSHNDKVEAGDGVIDNWSGTTLVAHLHKTERDVETEAGRLYIAFAREEEGLLGSQYFLRSLTPQQRAKLEGDVNYDTIAIKGGGTNSWENNSDNVLLEAGDAAVAEANKTRGPQERLELVRDTLNGGDADSSSFRWQRPPIPAMTIYSGPEDLLFSIIHSARDNFGAFDFLLYKNTYQVAVALLHWLDAHPLAPSEM